MKQFELRYGANYNNAEIVLVGNRTEIDDYLGQLGYLYCRHMVYDEYIKIDFGSWYMFYFLTELEPENTYIYRIWFGDWSQAVVVSAPNEDIALDKVHEEILSCVGIEYVTETE